MAGALPVAELHSLMEQAGLKDARITAEFKSFQGTTSELQVAPSMKLRAANFTGRK
ncbi:MAG: hypothetical protein H6841_08930 [Planctomycetes bacterium]|nr:hypothetical protein [Planctomycetota bacterium]MCB9936121.1 hypothetical protein [Planctomycetota bacterium]